MANEVAELHSQGNFELKKTKSITTSKNLYSKSQEIYLRETYAKQKKLPQDLVNDMEVDPELLKTKQEEQMREDAPVEEFNARVELNRYFQNNPGIEAKCIQYTNNR